MRSCLLLLGIASLAISAQAAADCSRMYQVAQQVLASSRTIVTPVPSGGNGCSVQLRDSGLTNSSVGTLTATAYGNAGPLLTDYRRATDRCETMDGLGQMAELCVFSNDYYHHRLSLVVYRNERRVLDLNFVDWPTPPVPARDEARRLADGILGAFAPAPLKEPVLSKSGAPGDRAEQLKRELTPKAESGNAEAQFALAMLYRYGTRGGDGKLRPDYAAAAYWYQHAAVGKLSEAAYALGLLYRDGLGVQKDESAAIRLFTEAADAGNVHGMLALGTLYAMKGSQWGAYYLPWLKKAEEAGNAAASNELGVMNYEEALHESRGMEGLRQGQFDEAMKEFRRAAAGGDCDAIMNIGGMYFNGDGVPQDRNQARTWFLQEQECKGATDGMRKEAADFLAKLDKGQLPAVLTYQRSTDTGDSAALSGDEIRLGIFGLVLAAAAARQATSTPEENKQALENIKEQRAAEKEKEYCYEWYRDNYPNDVPVCY